MDRLKGRGRKESGEEGDGGSTGSEGKETTNGRVEGSVRFEEEEEKRKEERQEEVGR